MNKFKSVRITHNILQRIDFSYLAEFLRFMGIWVCEEILTEQLDGMAEGTENRAAYSAEVYVGSRILREDEAGKLKISAAEYKTMINGLPEKTVRLYESPFWSEGYREEGNDELTAVRDGGVYAQERLIISFEKEKQKAILRDFLERLLETVYEPQDAERFGAGQLDDLIAVYVEEEIWLHSLNMQYYANRPSEVIEAAEKGFLKAQEAVGKVLDNKKGRNEQYLYEYAFLWCQVKVNSACYYNKEILYFSLEKLSERCRELGRKFPEFSNAFVLLGLCYEPSAGSANEAVAAFMQALDKIESQCFKSAVYYWIGKRYESFRDRRDMAEVNFRKANECRVKFRNIFKLAIAAKDKGETEKALALFEEIADKLAVKKEMKFTDPLELEYLYKVYFQQSYICYVEKDYIRAIRYGLKCIGVLEEKIDESEYFEALYVDKETADCYRRVLRRRWNVINEYRVLADCYAKTFDRDRAEQYRVKAKELE